MEGLLLCSSQSGKLRLNFIFYSFPQREDTIIYFELSFQGDLYHQLSVGAHFLHIFRGTVSKRGKIMTLKIETLTKVCRKLLKMSLWLHFQPKFNLFIQKEKRMAAELVLIHY